MKNETSVEGPARPGAGERAARAAAVAQPGRAPTRPPRLDPGASAGPSRPAFAQCVTRSAGVAWCSAAAALVLWPSSAGCLGSPPAPVIEAPASVTMVDPAADVAPDDRVAVHVSGPVQLAALEWPVRVIREDGRALTVGCALVDGGRALVLTPEPEWPLGEHLTIQLGAGLTDDRGRPLELGDAPLGFDTRAPPTTSRVLVVRSPVPGQRAPADLELVTVALEPPLDAPPAHLRLVSRTATVVAAVERTAGELVLARLPRYLGPCHPLCPGVRYRVAVVGGGPLVDSGARQEVETATATDPSPPVVTSTAVVELGDRVALAVRTSEPVLLRGHASPVGGGPETELVVPLVASTEAFAEPALPLPPDTEHLFQITGEDLAGRPFLPLVVRVRAPPALSVAISEIVPAPTHDWGDSDGSGTPFDARPGHGTVSATDQWVELVNLSGAPIDLGRAGLVLRALDQTPAETPLERAPALYFGDGGAVTSWWPGEALVVRPRGSLSKRAFTIEILRGSTRLDRVVVGDGDDAVMRSGAPPDLDHEALQRGADGRFRWCLPTPGDPLPSSDCATAPPR